MESGSQAGHSVERSVFPRICQTPAGERLGVWRKEDKGRKSTQCSQVIHSPCGAVRRSAVRLEIALLKGKFFREKSAARGRSIGRLAFASLRRHRDIRRVLNLEIRKAGTERAESPSRVASLLPKRCWRYALPPCCRAAPCCQFADCGEIFGSVIRVTDGALM